MAFYIDDRAERYHKSKIRIPKSKIDGLLKDRAKRYHKSEIRNLH
ncbi:hypothetical protein D1AOALGA4SA_9541 [Olavius algarvensis Delta 1 endosymbiont]|nr:hypothetical protein D1AOALGA4SA_9541 [Olavius algarvensis Delta 1 endosymbiont]